MKLINYCAIKYKERTKIDEIKTVEIELNISKNVTNTIKSFILQKNFLWVLSTPYILMKLSQTISTITWYVSFIIKTKQEILQTSNSMQFTLNFFHVMSHYFLLNKVSTNSSYLALLKKFLLTAFSFLPHQIKNTFLTLIPQTQYLFFPFTHLSFYQFHFYWKDQRTLYLLDNY